jgi:hypothetical protein
VLNPPNYFRPFWRLSTVYLTTPCGTGVTNFTVTAGTIYALPILVDRTRTFTKIGIPAGSTAVASSNARLAIYNVAEDGGLGTLVLDCGTVDTSTIGWKELTISQSLKPGQYFLAFRCSHASPIAIGTATGHNAPGGKSITSASSVSNVFVQTRTLAYASDWPADETAETYGFLSGAPFVLGIR